jgi:hypothetical protein
MFLAAMTREKKINFKEVEKERVLLIDRLVRTLHRSDLEALIGHSVAQRGGRESLGRFYADVLRRCRSAGISLEKWPALRGYIDYVLLAEQIQAESLFRELVPLENAAYDRRTRTTVERRLIQKSRLHRLAAKLSDFSLTPQEWAEYIRAGGPDHRIDPRLATFEDIYKEAFVRDEKMAENVLRALGGRRLDIRCGHGRVPHGGHHPPTDRIGGGGDWLGAQG